MREVINISLPSLMAKDVKTAVKAGGYASTSEFFRHLLRLWNTYRLAEELKRDRKKFNAGKGILLKSLKDLR
ncbi:MAG: ribbon-helix-helix domain-containing protein [Candidatus Komeilibacteria bacterium]|nr:ribbon-helix-helix domain-containing protein [Candidatus Komeilibacteria bacterium]